MTTTTTLARSDELSYDVRVDGWSAHINGGEYTDAQQSALVDALMLATENEVNDLLPEGCYWSPDLSEITGPDGEKPFDRDEIDQVIREAIEAVTARFDRIETEVLKG